MAHSNIGMADQHITIEGRFDQIATLSDLVERVAKQAGFTSRDQYALQLAVCEALENIITHGYQGESSNLIEAQVIAGPGEVQIEIWDDAPPFNPIEEPVEIDWTEEDPPVGGLGLMIIQKVMDEIRYERKGERNLLQMLKRQNPAEAK